MAAFPEWEMYGDDAEEATHDIIMERLKNAKTVSEQMEMLYDSLRLTDYDEQQRRQLSLYIEDILLSFFPSCTVHQYGSSASGLGMRGCDLDLFVDLHEDALEVMQRHHQLRQTTDWNENSNRYYPHETVWKSTQELLQMIGRVLYNRSQDFRKFYLIPSKRHPILRFQHIPTGISCDLSLRDPHVLENTKLLKLYASDRRVKLVLFTVRYWAKCKQLLNERNTSHKLTSYCLSVLVIYSLSNWYGARALPSVSDLKQLAGKKRRHLDGLKSTLPDELPPSENCLNPEELLQEFFRGPAQGFVKNYIILTDQHDPLSPDMASVLERLFDDVVLNDFLDKPMAIMDPLRPKNIAIGVNLKTRDLFVSEMRDAAKKMGSRGCHSGCGLVELFNNFYSVPESHLGLVNHSTKSTKETTDRLYLTLLKESLVSRIFLVFMLFVLTVKLAPQSAIPDVFAFVALALFVDYVHRQAAVIVFHPFSYTRAILGTITCHVLFAPIHKWLVDYLHKALPKFADIWPDLQHFSFWSTFSFNFVSAVWSSQ